MTPGRRLRVIQLLVAEIAPPFHKTTNFFALHKCRDITGISALRVPRRPFDGDLGVPHGQNAEDDGAEEAPQNGASGHEAEEHQHAAMAFKIRGFKDFDLGQASADAERGTAKGTQQKTQ
jgi:hypothetical protein